MNDIPRIYIVLARAIAAALFVRIFGNGAKTGKRDPNINIGDDLLGPAAEIAPW
jgi:hypothetical protein